LQPGSERRREALVAEATALAREQGDPRTLAYVLGHRLLALVGPDDVEERLATAGEPLAPRAGHRRPARPAGLTVRLHHPAELGERAALDLALAEFEQRSRAYPHPFFRWLAAGFRTAMALLEGRFADAEALANEALSRGQEISAITAFLNYGQQ